MVAVRHANMMYSMLSFMVLAASFEPCKPFLPSRTSRFPRALLSISPDPDQLFSTLSSSSLSDALAPVLAGVGLVALASTAATRPPSRLIDPSMLKKLVQGSYLENKADQLQCVYKASRDGWSSQDFHTKVDNLGSAIVAAKVSKGIGSAIIGGYNPNGWRSTDDYYLSNQAFLWTTTATNNQRDPIKLPILPGSNAPALFDYATAGPCFGTTDLQIGPLRAAVMGGFAGPDMEDTRVNAGDLRQGKSSVVNYEWTNQWPVRGSFRVIEVEVYCRR